MQKCDKHKLFLRTMKWKSKFMYKHFRTNGFFEAILERNLGDPNAHITKCIELGQNDFATFTDLVKPTTTTNRSTWSDHKNTFTWSFDLIFGSVCLNAFWMWFWPDTFGKILETIFGIRKILKNLRETHDD